MKRHLKFIRARSEEGVGTPHGATVTAATAREEGAILILALAFLVAVSLVVALLSTWATNDLNNSTHFTSASSLTMAATDMTDVAIQYVRYTPGISSNQPVAPYSNPAQPCWGGNSISAIPVIDGDQVAVWCSTEWNPLNTPLNGIPDVTRDVTFYACSIAVDVTAAACESAPLLTSEVRFDDYPPAPARSAPIQTLCSVWCGSGMEIVSWQWGSSAPGVSSGPGRILTFSNEPSDTSAGGITDAAVYVTDSNLNPVVGDTISIVEASGPTSGTTPPTPGITAPTSTLTAITNSLGVAEFTNIEPQYAGSYTLSAVDTSGNGPPATSTSFAVSMQRAVITPSTAPANASVNGPTYTPTATVTPGTTVTIGLDSGSTGCKLNSGVVSFSGPGTCMLDFNDNGNATWAPALQVVQSFPVGGQSATQVVLTLSNKKPPASSTTNVAITLTLENSVGVAVPSSGTTNIVLSDIGSGMFSSSQGVAGTSSLTVSFTNTSTATAYFGDANTGPDTISAVYGTTNWGSASLTIQGGAATQVAIAPSTPTPTVSSLTNTSLNFQLEDQYGNPATSSGTTTLALSDSGNGFFATANGTTGASTLNVTFADGVGTATVYFGDEGSGTDIISAKNGASVWATSTLTLAAGAATTVQITLAPTTPPKSNSTSTTVTLQLLDQFGNHATTSGVSLVLSNSGNGFFDARSGLSVAQGATTTLTLTTNAGVATGYFGDNVVQSDTITATGPSFAVSTSPFTV